MGNGLFDKVYNPDVLSCLANLSNDEVFTPPEIVNQMLERFEKTHDNVKVFDSLGAQRYLSALKGAVMVIGNSSSGLVEVPSFKIPTINIGDRQKGRLKAESVIDCEPEYNSICEAIEKAESIEFRRICQNVMNPYGDGNTTQLVMNAINQMMDCGNIDLKKKFYDIK